MTRQRLRILALIVFGAMLGAVVSATLDLGPPRVVAQDAKRKLDIESLAAEIETIKGRLPDQAHAMQDVGYHFTNLWFAGQKEHWELASFYCAETKSHMRWAVRIIPVRKDTAGQEVFLERILGAMESTPLKQLESAIAAKDKEAFDKAYRFTMESCYACHKAVDKPFLHPQIPTQPESRIMNFDPKPDWPK